MNTLKTFKNTKIGPLSLGQVLFWLAVLVVVSGGFVFIRSLVICWTITALPGSAPSTCRTVSGGVNGPVLTNEQGTPIATTIASPPPVSIPASDIPPAWDGASRITVLIIG